MDLKDLSIATISWARNPGEEDLLRHALEQLAQPGIPVFITDGGSGKGFTDFLKGFSHFTLLEGKGLWAQAKGSLHHAYESGSKFLLYTEPDKLLFFANYLGQMLAEVKVQEDTGIITATRSPEAFTTFPSFQQVTETTINHCCAELIGKAGDYTYGPFLLSRTIVPHLESLPPNIGWGWRPYAFNIAKRLGLNVNFYEGDFFCPEEQRTDDPAERLYRMKQLSQNIEGLTLSAAASIEAVLPKS